jgi:hypothetical protein
MQKSLFLFILFLSTSISYSQNLVQNGDFEDLSFEPCGISMTSSDFTSAMLFWDVANFGTPDIFLTSIDSTCWNYQPNSYYPGPIGLKGPQEPHSGESFVGIFAYTIPDLNQRDYIQTQLSTSMVIGNEYIVAFYVSLADSTEFAIDNLGVYLSNNPIFASNDGVLDYDPQVIFPDFISETEDWVQIIDTIEASSNFSYITIGNFDDDENTSTLSNPEGGNCIGCYGAYYFIDDVSVTELIGSSIPDLTQDMKLDCYPNPFSSFITITSESVLQKVQISIYDASGKIISNLEEDSGDKFMIPLENLQKGVYFVDIQHRYGMETKRIIKVDE